MEESKKENINNNNEVITPADIKKLLEENLELTRETHKIVKKIKSHIVLEQVLNIIKILVIVVPIILGIIYLPSILKPLWDQYQQAIGVNSSDFNMQNLQKTLNSLKQPQQ
jgi:hypothetical protein